MHSNSQNIAKTVNLLDMFSTKYYYPHFIASVVDIQGQGRFLLINGASNMCMLKNKWYIYSFLIM